MYFIFYHINYLWIAKIKQLQSQFLIIKSSKEQLRKQDVGMEQNQVSILWFFMPSIN